MREKRYDKDMKGTQEKEKGIRLLNCPPPRPKSSH